MKKNDLWLLPSILIALFVTCYVFGHNGDEDIYEVVVLGKYQILSIMFSNAYFFMLALIWAISLKEDKEARKEMVEAIKIFFGGLLSIMALPNIVSHLNQQAFIANISFILASYLPMILMLYVRTIYYSTKNSQK